MRKSILIIVVLLLAVSTAILAGGKQEGKAGAEASALKSNRWQDEYPTIVFSAISSENEADRITRHKYMIKYLEEQLEVKVEFYSASDYAGTIEALKAGKVHLAGLGTASYVRAWIITDGNVEPLVTELDSTGSSGYHSSIWVKTSSSYNNLDDLKGKSLAFADPNSTSGFLVPSYYLRNMGKEPDSFFGNTGFAGNHEMGILAVIKGTYDAACTWYRNEERNNCRRMADKGMIDLKKIRMIWKSPLITNGPITCPTYLPEKMKEDFIRAMLNWPDKDPDGWVAYNAPSEPGKGYMRVNHERYIDFVEMTRLNDAARKQQ